LERGLISYSTLGVYNQNMAFAGAELVNVDGDMRWDATNIVPDNVRPGLQKLSDKLKHTTWGSIFRPRTFLYMGVYAAIGLTMLGVLATRDRLDIGLEKDRNPIFVKMSDGSIRNGYTLKIKNMEQEPRRFNVTVEGFDVVTTRVAGDNTAYGPTFFVDVDSSAVKTMHVFLRLQPGAIYAETMNFRFSISQVGGREREIKNAKFEGPPEAVHWKGQTP
ncbi:MAG: FixG Ig-like domain-containing protein, partial [Pseudomonadota bacterium]